MADNENDLNEQLEEEMDDATVITVPIDATLSNSGEAADAKAVGDALALKADASSVVTIDVNDQEADAQGHIALNAGDIPLSDSDQTTVAAALASVTGSTAETIPMSSETGADSIADAIEALDGKTGESIPVKSGNTTTIAAKIDAMDAATTANSSAITSLQGKSGETLMITGDSTTTIKEAIDERVLMVNGERSDASGNVRLDLVPLAENLQSDQNQTVTEEFTRRTSGGQSGVKDGNGWLLSVRGNRTRTGYVPEELEMTTEGCTATIDRDTFVEEVSVSGTTTLTYSDGNWSSSPATYGVTVSGTPDEGATIVIVYVKEERGTITPTAPEKLVSTGWNLYNHTNGYAAVMKYSDEYGFGVSGTYTKLEFATSISGSRTTITPVSGQFTIPSDGYVFVTGGNNTNTAIWMTWSDWTSGYQGSFATYTESEIDLDDIMDEYFTHGLLRVGDVRDEINLSTKKAISWIEYMAYSGANRAAAEATGRAYEFDETSIYLVRSEPVENDITITNTYTVSDHGLEFFSGESIPVLTMCMYGTNLKNKLERDVLMLSKQTLTSAQQAQTRENIDAAAYEDAVWKIGDYVPIPYALVGWAHSSSQIRVFERTEKLFPDSGIKLTQNFTISGVYKYDGTSVDITSMTVAVSKASNSILITLSGLSSLTTNAQYLVKFSTTYGVSRAVIVEAAS